MKHLEPDVIDAAAKATPEGEVAIHLASCAECRADVKSARARQKLLGGLTPYTLSDVAFRRVEARLDEAVREGEVSPGFAWGRWLGFGAVAIAAAAALFVVSRGPSAPGVVPLPAPQVELAKAVQRPLTVIRAQELKVRTTGDWREGVIGEVLPGDAALSATSVTLSDAQAEWRFVASGSLSLGGVASVTLGAGELVAEVSSAEPVTVISSSRGFVSADALFSVSRVGAEVVLRVERGSVDVVDSSSGARRTVKAPAALRWSDGSSLEQSRDEAVQQVVAPSVPTPPWASFDARALAVGTQVSLDGAQLGTSPFIELVTVGRRRLALTTGGVVTESWVDLVGASPFVAAAPLPEKDDVMAPSDDALKRVMSELRSQTPKLAACYEKWLKANPAAQGEVVLSLTVSAQGRVRRATLGKTDISAASAECLVRTSKSLVLSPLGAEATLEVPLVLHHR